MTLRMADGPPGNLPAGMDAYGGYVNPSGIGETWPAILERFPQAGHLSITTDGIAANCADVERGAMSSWAGYPVGYCSVSNVNDLVARFGRPRKLWTAHQDPAIGAHICSPQCWPGLVTTADGTQHTDHQGLWDESLLEDDFFDFLDLVKELDNMLIGDDPQGNLIVVGAAPASDTHGPGNLLVFTEDKTTKAVTVRDWTDAVGPDTAGRVYRVT